MYKVVLVDDEEYVMEGLEMCIDWQEYNMRIVGKAKNGEDALKIIKKEKPDIIITDIYMPKMDGLDLIEKTLEFLPHVKAIILSGYEDFKYAQTAIRNKAFDYILKPIESEKIEEVIVKAKERIKKEQKKIENEKKLREQLKKSMPILKEKYMRYLLRDILNWEELRNQHDYLNINLEDNNFVVLVMDLEEIKEIESERKQLITLGIKNKIQNKINEKFKGEVLEDYTRRFVVILNYNEKNNEPELIEGLQKITKTIKQTVKNFFGCKLTIGIGRAYREPDYIAKSYQEAKEALEYRIFLNEEIIYFGDVTITKEKQPLLYPINIEEKLIMAQKLGDVEGAIEQTKNFIEFYRQREDIPPEDLKRSCLQLIYIILRKLVAWNMPLTIFENFKKSIEEDIKSANSCSNLEDSLIAFMKQIAKKINDKKEEQTQSQIKRACDYIENNYDRDLSLSEIASSVHLTRNYFANLFKEKTGKTVMEYLTEIRMRKAQALLKNTELKIYEITERVGFNNSNYFAKVFKKYYQVSPHQYRNQF